MPIVITGGALRGRSLPGRVGRGVRPSSARLREALFSMVGQHLDGVHVLDAYAGSGLLGFEAVSRGAASLTAVETDGRTLGALKQRAHHLGIELEALHGACPGILPPQRTWDLVLADPPYEMDCVEVLEGLEVHVGERLVLEHQSRWEPVKESGVLHLEKHGVYGNSALSIYEKHPS